MCRSKLGISLTFTCHFIVAQTDFIISALNKSPYIYLQREVLGSIYWAAGNTGGSPLTIREIKLAMEALNKAETSSCGYDYSDTITEMAHKDTTTQEAGKSWATPHHGRSNP